MTIQLMELSKWQELTEGQVVRFNRDVPRTVRIDLNTPDKVTLWVAQGDEDDAQFLALIEGRDRVEFSVDGAFTLTVDGGNVSFFTVDGADFSMLPVDGRSFTKIAERRARNPELELMMQTMYRNMERRLEQTAHDLEEQYERRERQRVAAENRRAAASSNAASDPAGKAPAKSNVAVEPKTPQGGEPSGKPAKDPASVSEGGTPKK